MPLIYQIKLELKSHLKYYAYLVKILEDGKDAVL